MPYKVFGLCVHKLNADGSKGERVKCHKTPAEAAEHVKALYANVKDSERGLWPTLLEAVSTNQKMDAVRRAFTEKFNPQSGNAIQADYCYIKEFFLDDGYLIAEKGADLYRVDFSKSDDEYKFPEKSEWKKVQLTYTAESKRLYERTYSTELRKQYAKQGIAMPDGSYPIPDKAALSDAIQAYGRSPDEATKRHITKRARALGAAAMLPEKWSSAAAQTGAKNAESLRTGYFAERIDLRESELDAAEFIARRVTLIRPGFSTNTDKAGRVRYYPPETLRQAAKIFEGTRAYADHPRRSDEKELPERSIRDLVGYYANVSALDDGRLVGDYKVVGEARQWLWPLITEAVQHKPDLVELSINALGRTRLGEAEGRAAIIVESIVDANSVDVVTTGAAGGSFAGALLHSDGGDWTGKLLAALSFDEWRAARPEFIEQLKGEWKTVRESEAAQSLKQELMEAKQKIEQLSAASRADDSELANLRREKLADGLLAESGLPHKLRAAVRPELLTCADEAGMKTVLTREKAKYDSLPRVPVSVSGAGQKSGGPPDAAPQPVHPAVALMGLDESAMPQPGESAEEYRLRKIRGQ